uniref:Cytochrome c oxidase subunit 2 n=1 Tax=Alpheus lobidens TaxID=1240032 RepID=A0A0C5BKK3_9EUCA|nr:cytochrome c oxidase subunit 2 [Alpheus lobidens]
MATRKACGFQDSASPLMEQLIFFHDHVMLILVLITTMVSYMMFTLFSNKLTNRVLLEHQAAETTWTILPAVTLIFIALPSLRLLYLLDEVDLPTITLKAIGRQWYWSYEYSDFLMVRFDAYMTNSDDSEEVVFRGLDVDNRTVLPMNTQVRTLVTASDVIHSWAVPALGVKVDAVPGRLNQASLNMTRPGLFYGQCSEICGPNHSFMPIVIESTSTKYFMDWAASAA